MRFWGKIRGTGKDYFIIEGVVDKVEEVEGGDEGGSSQVEGVESRGTGVNKYAYWVTNSVSEPWVMLPDLKPKDIINARKIKFCFSGNLNAKIYTNPFYFDTEKILLRA